MKISIEGNIGSGKSTLLTRLCQEYRIPVFLEPIGEWGEWLDLFYKDPFRWGMSFNLKVLLSFNKWKKNNFVALYERSPLSNRYVFAQLQHDDGNMNALELKLFQNVYDELGWEPEIVIYLRTNPDTSMQRMKTRDRACEKQVELSYIQSVHNKYESLFSSRDNTYIIDGNQDCDAVYKDVVDVLNYILK